MVRSLASDPIPEYHLSVMEAFSVFREIKHGEGQTCPNPRWSPEWKEWHERYSRELNEDEAQFCDALKTGKLEALVVLDDGNRYRVRADEICAAGWPARMLYADEIQDFSDGPLFKFRGRTPFISRATFRDWAERETTQWLYTAIASGRCDPNVVERRLAAHGLKPLNPQPDPSNFNPLAEPCWTLAMAVTWISSRTLYAVTQQWAKFVTASTYWSEVKAVGQERPGFVLQAARTPSLNDLLLDETEGGNLSHPQHLTAKEAQIDLWHKLQLGDLVATGKPEDGNPRKEIAPHEWNDLALYLIHGVETVRRDILLKDGYTSIAVRNSDVVRLWSFESPSSRVIGRGAKRVKSKPGPKPKIDPREFEREAHRWIDENGLPDPKIDPSTRQADLERHMMNFHRGAIEVRRNRDLVREAIETFSRN